MTTPTTPGVILAGNIAAARARRGLQQSDLADRMRELGWKWVRQTVGEVENNRRRLAAEEVFGLAICLGTSIVALTAPVDDDKIVRFPSGEELSVTAVQMLARGLSDIGVSWYGNKLALVTPAVPVERFREVFGEGARP